MKYERDDLSSGISEIIYIRRNANTLVIFESHE